MSNQQTQRQQRAFDTRVSAATIARSRPLPRHSSNGDEDRFGDSSGKPTFIASFTKALPHLRKNGLLANPADYELFKKAINTGLPQDILALPIGPPKGDSFKSSLSRSAPQPVQVRAWESMAAGLTFDLEGPDAQAVTMPPAPSLISPETAFELSELYWMALLRDVPIAEFGTNPLVRRAVDSLNNHQWIKNPAKDGPLTSAEKFRLRKTLTPQNIFRGQLPGDLEGPYISQFLLMGTPGLGGSGGFDSGLVQYGGIRVDQRVRIAKPKLDYLTTFESWLDVQNGADLRRIESYQTDGPLFRFIATPRDMATWVHYDALYEAYLNACLILLNINSPFDKGLPFRAPDKDDKQTGFATFGGPHILSLVTEVATRALKAARYQKFNIHRRLRPEAGAWIVDGLLRGGNATAAFDDAGRLLDLIDGDLLQEILKHNRSLNTTVKDGNFERGSDSDPWTGNSWQGTYLLPLAFTEGSPVHPSYGTGHGTVAGACVTVLKAFFDTNALLPVAFAPSADGSRLVPTNAKLTVGGELNKVASNVSIGRDWAGVHWYSDYIESVKLGEEIAIGILQEQKITFNEQFSMTLHKFDNTTIVI